ncbi:A-kinase anchor protein 13-like isoform X2 [Parambassis ranga]|uniref:A-kinase anchor protein 13-like isoform X2 n=1 Tax=Parambassis ranga TaxID=210632 RepID=A0A6P7K974_9TELE|nr:A-kinase anchor protein 13-like isoform X2 [Parambassis ranga]
MKLNPKQAPLYGGCVLTVQLDQDDVCGAVPKEEEEGEVEFYLSFSGSTQRHVSSTLRVSHITLQAACPAHNVCEQVLVTLCLARPDGSVDTCSQETFSFVQDLALDIAHFFLDSTAPQEVLPWDKAQIPLEKCERLDENLAQALKHLSLSQHRTAPAQAVTHTPVTETHQATLQDVSSLGDSSPVVSPSQQLSGLLHLAARHGLKAVASFLLQQPEGKEALKRLNTQGEALASLTKTRAHQQLEELVTQYEASNVQVNANERLHLYPQGRVFQCHADVGTYSLTLECGSDTDCCVQEEVKELRRLIKLKKSDTPIHASIHEEEGVRSTCVLESGSNGQQTRAKDAVTIDNCRNTTEQQERKLSLDDRAQREDSDVVTHTSCTSGQLCQSQEAGKEQRGTPAASSRRNKRHKKSATKTQRRARESNQRTPEACRKTAQGLTETGRGSKTVSPREQSATLVIGGRGAAENQQSPGTQETLLPIKPVLGPGGDGKWAGRKAVALPITTIIEKQEGEKWEVELPMCERDIGTEAATTTAQGKAQSFPAREVLEPAAEKTVTMGQEQSQDTQESKSVPEDLRQPDSLHKSPSERRRSPKSPEMERKHRTVLNPDAHQIGSRTESPSHGPETARKTVWYEGENVNQGVNGDSDTKEVLSQSIWYDNDSEDEREQPQSEQAECGLNTPQVSCLSDHPLSADLSQSHAAGTQPVLSHGPDSQRPEVLRSQQDEDVSSAWKEGQVCNRERRKSSETADNDEREGAKGRKKRRKKRGKRGGAEARLDSSSSTESQSQIETEKNLNPQPDIKCVAKDKTGRADIQAPAASEATLGDRANQDAVPPPSRNMQGPVGSFTTLQVSQTDDAASHTVTMNDDSAGMNFNGQHVNAEEVHRRSSAFIETGLLEPVVQETVKSDNEELAAVQLTEQIDLVKSECPGEHSEPAEFTDSSLLVEFPGQNALLSADENKHFLDSVGGPAGSVHPTEADDGMGASWERSAQTAAREQYCTSERPIYQQGQETRNEGEAEGSGEIEKNDAVVPGKIFCSMEEGTQECSSSDREKAYNEDLVAAAVTVVAVALASAVATIELKLYLVDRESGSQASDVATNNLLMQDTCVRSGTLTLQGDNDQSPHTDIQLQISSREADLYESGQLGDKVHLNPDLSALSDGASLLQADTEEVSAPTGTQANEITTPDHIHTDTENQLHFPVVELEDSGESKHQAVCQKEDGGAAKNETEGQEHLTCEAKADEEHFTNTSACHPQTDEITCEGEIFTLSGSTLPVSESAVVADVIPEETAASVDVEKGEILSPKSSDKQTQGTGSHLEAGKDNREGDECFTMEDGVDGRDTERNEVEDTSKNEALLAEKEEETDTVSTETLQIQRETDVFCPLKSSLKHSRQSTCTDVHPDRQKECVLVCLPHRDADSLTATDELNGSVFKKPEDLPTCLSHKDSQVCVSWPSTTKNSGGALSVSEEALSASRTESCRLSWKSETEDRGGGETEAAGDEEEKKDHLPENPVASAILRASIHSLSPFRRHSWEPGRINAAAHCDIMQHSSLRSQSEEVKKVRPTLHRRSVSWCPSNLHCPHQEQTDNRSYSLEGLEEGRAAFQIQHPNQKEKAPGLEVRERGSLVSLTEKEQYRNSSKVLSLTAGSQALIHHQPLTKAVSMVTISHQDMDGLGSLPSNRSLGCSISEEKPGPLQMDTEGKGGPKISRTFSYLRSKMSKKSKEKDKERRNDMKRESKEREKKSTGAHPSISPVSPNKDVLHCNATSSASSLSSTSSSSSREHWATSPDDQLPVMVPRRHPSIFNAHSNLAKSISISNVAGLDEVPLKSLKFLSQSTDSLHQGPKVNASTESLTDEGTDINDSQLMGEFEYDVKDLEADSWSGMVDKKFLKTLKKDEIKRQDVIYELYQTEFHHVRTLKIMSEVYYKGLQKELQLNTQTLDKIFPVLAELVEMHAHFLTLLLERKRSAEGRKSNRFLISRVGDVLVNQFSGCCSEHMKDVYGKFCSNHNEAVNLYKDLHAKDKRFQTFIKKMMSSSIVRRLSIPECILLVTQRITKYPVLIQRILQHTKDSDEDHSFVSEALRCVKELITAVDCKVNEHEKKRRLREVYSRTDSKSIMRMKSGQMFAKEDLIRGRRRLLHDGGLQLKNSTGRLKDVHAVLLSDVLVFLQEKDQKYVFASLDQRSTVISLQSLIVREVANEERGLFLITAGIERPEMVEVLAISKEERNVWRAIIQEAMHFMEKDEDEGVPSDPEDDRKQQDNRAKEFRELIQKKDEEIISLLEEKVHIFREFGDCSTTREDTNPPIRERMLFRATPDNFTKGEPIINVALREVDTLQALVSSGGAGCSVPVGLTAGGVGPVCLPRRAETFGGFDSHQMNSSKNGERQEDEESLELRRTESDSVLKKRASGSLQMLLKRNNEVVRSVTHLRSLLISLQAVVIQQDSFIEAQRQTLSGQLTTTSSRQLSSSSVPSSSSSSRHCLATEQDKHRSLQRQQQEAASLQKQQAAHQEEKRRREKEWVFKEKGLAEREEKVREEEEEIKKRQQELMEETKKFHRIKDEYKEDLETLRKTQMRLERDKEALRRDTERLEKWKDQSEQLQRDERTPSTTSEDSLMFHSSGSLDLDLNEESDQAKEVQLSSSAPTKEHFLRIGSKRMGKNFNPFSSISSSKPQGAEKESQLPTRLLQLAKPKEKKDKKKKKGKGVEQTQTENWPVQQSRPSVS